MRLLVLFFGLLTITLVCGLAVAAVEIEMLRRDRDEAKASEDQAWRHVQELRSSIAQGVPITF